MFVGVLSTFGFKMVLFVLILGVFLQKLEISYQLMSGDRKEVY